ncbi:ABC transporter ATP-binding protein/permease [Anaerosinus massiliensis]|uniref:ABC transporter ATP-binding protein/permease n=1 Tax=Massilibacillus massiliensis TaxID=1806837 RepID=UPI000A90DF42|nr:ABC transporter ATP-binding protein/permease [Massilibacillus massiliensis]
MRRGVVLRSAWRLGRDYLFSNQKWTAWGLLLLVVLFNLLLVYITVQINLWQATFYNIIQSHNQGGFIEAIGFYALLAIILVAVKGCQTYFRLLLHINWRQWLTDKYLSYWLKNKIYYRLQLYDGNDADNPDQRISEDVDLFVALTLRLSLECMQDALTVCSFIVILWNISEVITISIGTAEFSIYGYLVWAALIYALAGTLLTVKIGAPLIKLDYDQQKYEADFRFSLVRVREYAESIALYGGESAERGNCLKHFQHLVYNFREIIQIRKRLVWLTTGYAHAAVIFAIFVASPRYFSGKITLGHMFQIIDAFNHVQSGMSFIIDSFTRVAQWRAVVNRLNNFIVCMKYAEQQGRENVLQSGYNRDTSRFLEVKQVDVFKPDGQLLIKDLTFKLQEGNRLLITGPSGCGKSTLLRTLAGLWIYAKGSVIAPQAQQSLFVPQKPYMPIDTLRKALIYPYQKCKISDQVLIETLTLCKISYLAPRLEEVGDWGKFLSLGEQQRVAFVRILLAQPQWIFLDEATSALDDDNQALMYSLVIKKMPNTVIVSVGHRKSIADYHNCKLVLDGTGGWRLS